VRVQIEDCSKQHDGPRVGLHGYLGSVPSAAVYGRHSKCVVIYPKGALCSSKGGTCAMAQLASSSLQLCIHGPKTLKQF